MAVDSLDPCGVYFGTTGGQVYASPDAGTAGRPSCGISRPWCPSRSRRCHDPRRASGPPADARARRRRGEARRRWSRDAALVLDALEACYPMLRGTIRDQVTQQRRAFVRFFACEEDLSTSRRTHRCPTRSRSAPSLSRVAPWPAASRHGREYPRASATGPPRCCSSVARRSEIRTDGRSPRTPAAPPTARAMRSPDQAL